MKKAQAAYKAGSKYKKESVDKDKELAKVRRDLVELNKVNVALLQQNKELKDVAARVQTTPSIQNNSAPK
jgi:hypothetical protein